MGFIFIIIAIAIVIIIILIFINSGIEKKLNIFEELIKIKLLELKDFHLSDVYIGTDFKTGIAIDKSKSNVCLFKFEYNFVNPVFEDFCVDPIFKIIKPFKILSSSVSIFQFGQHIEFTDVIINLIINDDDFPNHNIQFGTFLDSYVEKIKKARFWEAIILQAINKNKIEITKCSYCESLKDSIKCSVCGAS